MLVLNYWNRTWQSATFNTENGIGQVRWFIGKPAQSAGIASKHKGGWYAVWRGSEHLVFQAGANRWPMTNDYRCTNDVQGAKRIFKVTTGNETVFALEYKAIIPKTDPTFDSLDLETTDFFYWVAKVWNDPALSESLKRAWKIGQAL